MQQGAMWPKVAEDYRGALVRLATARIEGKHYLVMGYVELFPRDIPPPDSFNVGEAPWTVPNFGGETTLGVSATWMSVGDALAWYEAAAGGQTVFPGARKSVATAVFGPEPAIGTFCVGWEIPFAARWHDIPRIHRLVPMEEVAERLQNLGSSPDARQWLTLNFGLDPFEYEEWLGSLAMLAPDPLLQGVGVYIQDARDDGGERLVLQAERRRYLGYPSDEADALSLVIFERRPGGWAHAASHSVDAEGFVIIQGQMPVGETGYAITCPKRGLLRVSPPHQGIGQLEVSLGFATSVLNVGVISGGKRKPKKSYQTHRVTDTGAMKVGDALGPSGAIRMIQLQELRQKRVQAQSAQQKVFGISGDKSRTSAKELALARAEAEDFVVNLVSAAQRRVIFVDPDWSLRETQNYAFRVLREKVQVVILTSKKALVERKSSEAEEDQDGEGGVAEDEVSEVEVSEDEAGASDDEVAEQDAAADRDESPALRTVKYLARVRKNVPNSCIQVKVMPGSAKKPKFHDRFVVVDDDVWACGPSFNELGERIGIITRMHWPEPIRAKIESVLGQSRDISEFVSASEAARDQEGGADA
jgi:hypothetical protein